MTFKVVVSPNAEADFLAITEYISRDSPARARTFVRELRDRFTKKLSIFPFSGVKVGKLRYTAFGNYVVVYIVDEPAEIVTIVLITEGHRDWQHVLDV